MCRFLIPGAIALATMLVAVDSSRAQMGPGQLGPLWEREGRGAEYPDNGGYPPEVPAATEEEMTVPAPLESQSFYNGPVDNRAVLLRVRVPADARVWIDGTPMTSTGEFRSYLSPPLNAGQNFVYHLRVQSNSGEQNRTVPVHSGDRVTLDFRPAAR